MGCSDGVYDRGVASHAVNLFDLASKYADVIPAQDAVIYLERLPGGSPER